VTASSIGVAAFISRLPLDVGRSPKCLHFVLARLRHLGSTPTQKARADYTGPMLLFYFFRNTWIFLT